MKKSGTERYMSIPFKVLRSDSYKALKPVARQLLTEAVFQYRGNNNGDLTLAPAYLHNIRGWTAHKQTIYGHTRALLENQLIVETRPGQFMNPGGVCALYGITWKAIDECEGKNLIVGPTRFPLRTFIND